MLPQDAQTSSNFPLGQFQEEPSRQEVLPKGYGLQNEAFMDESPESQGSPRGLEREVAKWQNRVTCFSSESESKFHTTQCLNGNVARYLQSQMKRDCPGSMGLVCAIKMCVGGFSTLGDAGKLHGYPS